VNGLGSVYHNATKSFWFSATFNDYHKKILLQVFQMQPNQLEEMPTQLFISLGREVEPFVPEEILANNMLDL
jgi:hypothetical protein